MRSVSFVLDMGLAAVRTACRGGGATQVTGEGRSLLQIKLHIVGKSSFPFF